MLSCTSHTKMLQWVDVTFIGPSELLNTFLFPAEARPVEKMVLKVKRTATHPLLKHCPPPVVKVEEKLQKNL